MTDYAWLRDEMAAAGIKARLIADSRQVQPGDVFLAWPGERSDGRRFITEALARGAAGVIYEPAGFYWQDHWLVPHWAVEGLATRAGRIAAAVYAKTLAGMRIAAVTGTNGKTSCAQWLAQAWDGVNGRCAVLGTIGNGFPGQLTPSINTTPDAIMLQTLLAGYAAAGATRAVMEASSHGLALGRMDGVSVRVALFTNLTRDHLDFHGDMVSYGEAKARLFAMAGLEHAVLNADDAFSGKLAGVATATGARVLTYGLVSGDVRAESLDIGANGIRMQVATPWGGVKLSSPMLGRFNAANLLGALGVLLADGMRPEDAAARLARVTPAPGRMQRLGGGKRPLVVVDYAHTPDALEKALSTLREVLAGKGRLICVFGCGGERDTGKRPEMGAIAARLADRVIVTTDNPRFEAPDAIAADVLAGAGAGAELELDRAAAIRRAVREAAAADVVLLAGKGHETYQEIGGHRLPFSDVEVAQAALEEAGDGQ